jgi:hypothetical protein
MNRRLFLILLMAPLPSVSAEPESPPSSGIYRMILKNTSGRISFLDDPKIKTLHLDLNSVEQGWPMRFGGPNKDRFKTLRCDRVAGTLTIEEVATKKVITLKVGEECVVKNP